VQEIRIKRGEQMSIKRYVTQEKSVLFFFSIVSIVVTVFLFACSEKSGPPPRMEKVPVTSATVIQKAIPVQLRAIGNVEAYSTISVKSQI
jgi:multidrug efflux pump subunit AcrA (membrane-fusion protein)